MQRDPEKQHAPGERIARGADYTSDRVDTRGYSRGRAGTSPHNQTRLIAEWPLGQAAVLRLALSNNKGRWLIDLRAWWKPDGGDEYFPTRKGTSLTIGRAREVHAALERALEEAEKLANTAR